MSAVIIDGKVIAKALRVEWKTRAEQVKEKGMQPGLAVIIVGIIRPPVFMYVTR